jgi:hypothetical protein
MVRASQSPPPSAALPLLSSLLPLTSFFICCFPAGSYGVNGTSSCKPCDPGYFGSARGLGDEAGGNCSGLCSAGHACPAGSASTTARVCPPDTFAGPGAWECTRCPDGTFSAAAGSAACQPCSPAMTSATAGGSKACSTSHVSDEERGGEENDACISALVPSFWGRMGGGGGEAARAGSGRIG